MKVNLSSKVLRQNIQSFSNIFETIKEKKIEIKVVVTMKLLGSQKKDSKIFSCLNIYNRCLHFFFFLKYSV